MATSMLSKRMMDGVHTRTLTMESTQEKAFLKAFDENADALFRHASFRLPTREDAIDATQDTFAKAWDYIRTGGEINHWRGFLFRSLHNRIIDEYRRKKEASLDALLDDTTASNNPLLATGSRSETEDYFDTKLDIKKINELIPNLPQSYRSVLVLRYIDGFSPKEIASILKISENTVSVRLHRSVKKLKEWCPSPEPK